ncbi:MAG: glycosyl transferase family 2, partial [Bauldia sp.]
MITAILAAGDDETGLAMTLSALVAAATEGVVRDA